MEGRANAQDVADALDDSRLAAVLDDSPERIHSDPLPSRPSFPDGSKSDGAPQHYPSGQIEAKDHQLGVFPATAYDEGTSNRTSTSHWDPEPGFAHIDGEIGGAGYNETKVDVITVPCPGADPIKTWTRDPLPDGFFGNPLDNELTTHPTLKELAGDAILSPGIGGNFPKAAHLWVKQGIRRYASTARVLLYRHRELTDTTTLDKLAQDLLEIVFLTRDIKEESRPLFFIAHSIGGLVVKKALLMASKDERYRHSILYNCHGVSFFGKKQPLSLGKFSLHLTGYGTNFDDGSHTTSRIKLHGHAQSEREHPAPPRPPAATAPIARPRSASGQQELAEDA